MKPVTFISTLVGLAGVAAWATAGDAAEKLIDSIHEYYIHQFEDLKGTEEGRFGISRIDSGRIDKHASFRGDPGFKAKDFQTSVLIYGAHGKPLKPQNIETRYARVGTFLKAGERLDKMPDDKVIGAELERVKQVLAQWKKDGGKPFKTKLASMTWEARPVRLSRDECLKCHAGMKKGDPVAVMVYRVVAKIKD